MLAQQTERDNVKQVRRRLHYFPNHHRLPRHELIKRKSWKIPRYKGASRLIILAGGTRSSWGMSLLTESLPAVSRLPQSKRLYNLSQK
jgi:hypothetical protein